MKSIFTITVITKENYGEGDPTLFTENGDMVGRTLAYRKMILIPILCFIHLILRLVKRCIINLSQAKLNYII